MNTGSFYSVFPLIFNRLSSLLIFALVFSMAFVSCSKDNVTIDNNDPPEYDNISSLLLRNYVNRAFIDLIGREPLDAEMDLEVALLQETNADPESRLDLIIKLQTNTDFIVGDTSYQQAYYHWFYESVKGRCIEGASPYLINQTLSILQGELNKVLLDTIFNQDRFDLLSFQIDIYEKLIGAEKEYQNGLIEIDEVYRRMIFNGIYDRINMNSFNFINATFDDLYFRFPTEDEFYQAYEMVEFDEEAQLFGLAADNKEDYAELMVSTSEFYQGLIIWVYNSLLAREPTTAEIYPLLIDFYSDHDFQTIQQEIMVSDEYANF